MQKCVCALKPVSSERLLISKAAKSDLSLGSSVGSFKALSLSCSLSCQSIQLGHFIQRRAVNTD